MFKPQKKKMKKEKNKKVQKMQIKNNKLVNFN